MKTLSLKRLALCCLVVFLPVQVMAEQKWDFRVWLDDKEIGRHEFVLSESENGQRLTTQAEFKYKLLFMTLYDYQHENTELWLDGCLQSLESQTNANGDLYRVSGLQQADEFLVQSNDVQAQLPPCVKSFAYWDRSFLTAEKLLNSQDGEYLEVDVSEPLQELLMVRGESIPATRYQLEAGQLKIRVWYSADDEWLALESDAKGGRILRYEIL